MPGRLAFDRQVLTSRVARRMFSVFAICSLLPILAFGIYAYLEVRTQLEIEAANSLRADSKAAGMAIVERLLIADERLRSLSNPRASDPAKLATNGLAGILSITTHTFSAAPATLSATELAHLRGGGALLTEEPGERSTPRLILRVALAPTSPAATLLAAELDPRWLFGPERRAEGDRYWVANEKGRVLFADPWDSIGAALPSPPGQGSPFEFDVGGSRQIGAAWPLFLRAPSFRRAGPSPSAAARRTSTIRSPSSS